MHPDRIGELLAPFLEVSPTDDQRLSVAGAERNDEGTDDALVHNISTYIDILLRWNARINLTAIRDPEEIVTRHFGESLFAARHLFPGAYPVPFVLKDFDSANDQQPATKARVADVGSGAGFPGIPLKLWSPHISLTLIESSHKKATFLREVVRSLTLMNINVFNGRAEDLSRDKARFDIVTLRAVEHFEDALNISAALLVPGGRLALLIGSPQQEAAAAILPSFLWSSPRAIPLSQSRVLLIGTCPEA
jgi:16S rRNA (guanine527-N7)-methyltransferase